MSLLRDRAGGTKVTNTELFFDLVYVVAVTELSDFIRLNPTWHGALEGLVLLALVWNAWVYTTWVTNWLDPDRLPTRVMLLGAMLASLVLTAGITGAFGVKGSWVAFAYATIQVGRSAYTVWATRGDPLQRNYQRILVWCSVSSAFALVGGFAPSGPRLALFAVAVVVDVVGGIVQFWVPVLGRSQTRDWTIDGAHFAERCQAFLLIALGESVVGVGAALIEAHRVSWLAALGFLGVFVGVVTLFLLYFQQWAEAGVEAITHADDPGRLGRVFHFVHPVMIAGIILTAAGDGVFLERLVDSGAHVQAGAYLGWFCAGGATLFVLGLLIYIRLIAGVVSIPHVTAAAVLLVLCLSPAVPILTVGLLSDATLVALFTIDATRGRSAGAGRDVVAAIGPSGPDGDQHTG
ncbi:low temperature requirement protein A [Leifsonia shinshuensis]